MSPRSETGSGNTGPSSLVLHMSPRRGGNRRDGAHASGARFLCIRDLITTRECENVAVSKWQPGEAIDTSRHEPPSGRSAHRPGPTEEDGWLTVLPSARPVAAPPHCSPWRSLSACREASWSFGQQVGVSSSKFGQQVGVSSSKLGCRAPVEQQVGVPHPQHGVMKTSEKIGWVGLFSQEADRRACHFGRFVVFHSLHPVSMPH